MDNIVVDDLEAVKALFLEVGLEIEGESTVEGPLVGNLIGLRDVRATLALMRYSRRTGHGRKVSSSGGADRRPLPPPPLGVEIR